MSGEVNASGVELAGVRKAFALRGGARPVLDGVSFTVAPGEFVALIGPSGCGKSTLFNLLAGLDSADDGLVCVGAEPVVTGSRRSANQHCAYMPQKDLLFPWRTVLENTALGLEVAGVGKHEARQRARKLFPEFGLAGFEDARPFQLSGGMRQRAAMLRTVVQERPVLLLDEPFGALDSLTRTEMQNWLQDVWLRDRRTVLMITHDIREAVYLADRVIVLSARPARVRREVTVPLPRPRELSMLTAPEFTAIEQELIAVLHDESRRALAEQESTRRL
jgi:ABC-type nitrate/sulfonate/bicarbonate transport system ATPase subunit